MRFSTRLYLLLAVFCTGFVIFGGISKTTIDTIKVSGPLYGDIILDKDLVADILPPPEYIIEPYLVVLQALDTHQADAAKLAAERLKALKADYDQRHSYWDKNLTSGPKRELLLQESYKPALAFFKLAEEQFLPALIAGNYEAAKSLAYGEMKQQYDTHRIAIDKLVKQANDDAAANEKQAMTIIAQRSWIMAGFGALILAVSLSIGLLVVRRVMRRLGGDPDQVAALVAQVSHGDLSPYTGNPLPGSLMEDIAHMVQQLRQLIGKVSEVGSSIASAATQLQATSREMSHASSSTSEQVNSIATAGEEMSATSNDISRTCEEAAEASRTSASSAQYGEQIVHEAVNGMGSLAERVQDVAHSVSALGTRSNQIGAIVGTIEDIADQTNLLALNAAIEAARAGEQGRGFAVVADEVRALAERTTKATKEISEMIKAIQMETHQAVHAMEQSVAEVGHSANAAGSSTEAIRAIMLQIDDVTARITTIATAAAEQTATTSDIANNLYQVSGVVQQTAHGAGETAAAAEQLAREAQELQHLVTQFKL